MFIMFSIGLKGSVFLLMIWTIIAYGIARAFGFKLYSKDWLKKMEERCVHECSQRCEATYANDLQDLQTKIDLLEIEKEELVKKNQELDGENESMGNLVKTTNQRNLKLKGLAKDHFKVLQKELSHDDNLKKYRTKKDLRNYTLKHIDKFQNTVKNA